MGVNNYQTILRIELNDQMCYSEHHLMVPEHFYCWVAGSFNRPWTNGNGGLQSRGDALPFYSSEGIPISIKSVGFPPRRPIPLPIIDSGLSSDAKYGGFER